MARIPTVTIWDPRRGAVDINASDYDPSAHRLYEGQEDAPDEPPVTFDASDVEDPVYRLDYGNGWWAIIGPDGEKVGKSTQDEDEARARLRELIAE